MDPNLRMNAQINTFYYFLIIMAITTVSQLITLLAIVFGDLSGKENVVAATVIASAFFGAFGIVRIMTNLMLIINEMDEKLSNTHFGKETKAIPIHILRFVFAGIFVLVAIVQLSYLYGWI